MVRRLAGDPAWDVRVSDERPAPGWMREECEIHTGDLREPATARAATAGCGHVIHLAALYNLTGDIGVAIILLTIIIRVLLIPVFRLHRAFSVRADAAELEDGLLVVVEGDGRKAEEGLPKEASTERTSTGLKSKCSRKWQTPQTSPQRWFGRGFSGCRRGWYRPPCCPISKS